MWNDYHHELDPSHAAIQGAAVLQAFEDGMGREVSEQEREDLDFDITRIYLNDIGRERVLTAEEERALARRLQQGSAEARTALITHNLKLVVHMAKRYQGRGLPLLDLIEEGNLGLMHALEKYDPERGIRLSTYAGWWIRQTIEMALMNQTRTIRLPVHVAKSLNRCLRARVRLEQDGMVDVGMDEIADLSGLPEAEVRNLLHLGEHALSLDAPLDVDPTLTVGDAIADVNTPPPEDWMYQGEIEQYVEGWLSGLSEKQRFVVERRFGLSGTEPATLEDLAKVMKVSSERVRQIQIEALEALARQLREKGLQPESMF